MDKTIRFTVSLPEELLKILDHRVDNLRYPSRSEYIRDLLREKTVEEEWQSDKSEVIGVLTIVYDHHQRELSQKMIDLQHNHTSNILCTTHVHIDHHNCLETIIIRGRAGDIEAIGTSIGSLKGVRFSRLTRASRFEEK